MSSIETRVDRPYGQQPETRAAATRYLERTGNTDLIPLLGLDDQADEETVVDEDGRRVCPTCGKPLPDPIANGGNKPCQRRACKAARTGALL